MKNRLILLGWFLLGLFGVSAKRIRSNSSVNGEVLRKGGFWQPGEYIENQAQWQAVRLGSKYDMAYGGCGIFAVYNVMVALGMPAAVEELEGLMEYFQRKGAALGGKFGIDPGAIRRFFIRRGFQVYAFKGTDSSGIDKLARQSEVFVVTACNSGKLRDWVHTVCITGTENLGYTVHNGYHREKAADGRMRYCAHGPFPTLGEAVNHISDQGALPVITMGIRR